MSVTVTSTKGRSAATVLIVGHTTASTTGVVEAEAARLASGASDGPLLVATEAGHVLLVKPKAQSWATGHDEWRILGSDIAAELRRTGLESALIDVSAEREQVQALVEGVLLGDYRFTACRSGKAAKRSKLSVRVPGYKAAVTAAVQVAEAQNLAREVTNAPGNILTPTEFVARARKAFRGTGVSISATSGVTALTKAGFPGLVQVGKGSATPPVLLEVRYRPESGKKGKGAKSTKAKAGQPHLALVGKGITFDSGGISLKPGPGMWAMKADMGGAAAVLGGMSLIAQAKPNFPVTAYFALAENMPDATAQKPGDTWQARNGTWVHVDNTDAEGRLVLADVLTYACEQGATHMLDFATLTGAAIIALGDKVAAIMGRHPEWTGKVRSAGAAVGETLWELPLHGEYRAQLNHPLADLNNIGGRPAGTITAGIFLSEFVEESVQWAHCDIAGPVMLEKKWKYYAEGFTGFGVRTIGNILGQIG